MAKVQLGLKIDERLLDQIDQLAVEQAKAQSAASFLHTEPSRSATARYLLELGLSVYKDRIKKA